MMTFLSLNRIFINSYMTQPYSTRAVKAATKIMDQMTKRDAFKGVVVDFTALPLKVPPTKFFGKTLRSFIEREKENSSHVIGLKIPTNCPNLIRIAHRHGFQYHHANPSYAHLNLCLKNHSLTDCTFPPYRTVSVGVTAVVFDETLENVLVVLEKEGSIKKWKPPTGGVDYGESGETPLNAAVRELKEEVQIDVDPATAIFAGTGWTNNYRGINPDISFIFAFVIEEMQQPTSQESEIAKAAWMPVKEFLIAPSEETEKPWLLRQAVATAFKAVQKTNNWKPRTLYLSTGKPVDFFGAS